MCNRKYKASELIKHWQGMYRCRTCWEVRHPQDFVRGVPDIQSVPWAQPRRSIYISFCSFNGQSAIPGYATPGCMIPGRTVLSFDDTIPAGG
jgi:hypothetical protein